MVTYGGSDIGSSNGISYGNGYVNIDGSALGESLVSEVGTEVDPCVRTSLGDVVGTPEVYLLVESLV